MVYIYINYTNNTLRVSKGTKTFIPISVLYCIMMSYTDGRLDRYRTGIPLELSEIRTQPWPSEGSFTCDP